MTVATAAVVEAPGAPFSSEQVYAPVPVPGRARPRRRGHHRGARHSVSEFEPARRSFWSFTSQHDPNT